MHASSLGPGTKPVDQLPAVPKLLSTPPIHASHVPAGAATAVVLPARPLVPTRQRVPRTHTNSRLGKRPNLTRISLSPALQESDYRKLLDLPPSANRRGSGLRLFLDCLGIRELEVRGHLIEVAQHVLGDRA